MRSKSYTALLAVLILALSACSKVPVRPSGAPAGPNGTSASAGAPLRIMVGQGNSTDEGALDVLIGAYLDQYPTARVEQVNVPSGLDRMSRAEATRAVEQAMADHSVDLITTQAMGDVDKVAAGNRLVPLDSGIKSHSIDLLPLGQTVSQLRIDGKLYALPYNVVPYALFYNPKAFQQAGVALPYPGWTWAQFRQAASQLTAGGGSSKAWGVLSVHSQLLVSAYFLQQSPDHPVTDQQTLEQGIGFFQTLIDTDQSLQFQSPTLMPFFKGKAAMAFAPWPFVAMSSATQIEWDVAPMPVSSGGTAVSLAGYDGLAMVAGSAHENQAWQFLQFAAGPKGAAALAKAGYVPAYQSDAVRQAWRSRSSAPPAGTEWALRATWHFVTPGGIPMWREPDESIEAKQLNLIYGVLSGTEPFADAYWKFSAEVNALRANNAQGGN